MPPCGVPRRGSPFSSVADRLLELPAGSSLDPPESARASGLSSGLPWEPGKTVL